MENARLTPRSFYGKGLPETADAGLNGKLIVIEGADGSGRSTQVAKLREWLERGGFAIAEVGLSRSALVAADLDKAKEGHTLCPITLSLFYATDFADQLENKIVPALRSGFVVIADRYIYTLMARALARGLDPEWLKDVYSIALVPDIIFYLDVTQRTLAERNFRKNAMLDYWESGMDLHPSGDMYECFIHYQKHMQKLFHKMAHEYGFEIVNGNRSPGFVAQEIQTKVGALLNIGEKTRRKKMPGKASSFKTVKNNIS